MLFFSPAVNILLSVNRVQKLTKMIIVENNLFTLANRPGAVRTRQTAGTKSLVAKFARTDQRKFSFSVRTVEKWNGLPETSKQAATQDGFKRSLKQTRQ